MSSSTGKITYFSMFRAAAQGAEDQKVQIAWILVISGLLK
jgi:hypothetical protein